MGGRREQTECCHSLVVLFISKPTHYFLNVPLLEHSDKQGLRVTSGSAYICRWLN